MLPPTTYRPQIMPPQRTARRVVVWAILAPLTLCAAACGNVGGPAGPVAIQSGTLLHLDAGDVQGVTEGGTRHFFGIPFARPPVGERRWQPPVPAEPWAGVLDASAMGPACAQNAGITSPYSENEDCLHLNVWTPEPAPSHPLPVMVWIHGGGNTGGSTADEVPLGIGGLFYDGRLLAEQHGVVVVSANYRLGVLGFLSHPALAGEDSKRAFSGNQALLDQRLALEWVRDNIAPFGGDPDNVTIFGESAGAFDVCFHVASPGSRGLFHRAISESGGCTFRTTTRSEGEARGAELATELGCAGAADPLACMRAVPVAELLARGGGIGPIVDGDVLPDQPRTLYDRGEFAKVPYLLGSNADEGTLFALTGNLPPLETEADYLAALTARWGHWADEIAALYPATAFASPRDAFVRTAGDSFLVCGTSDTARRASLGGAPVYAYNFARPIPIPSISFLGATHGAEIAYVFGSVTPPTPEDAALATALQGYWTRFARNGEPGGEGALRWPRWLDATDLRLELDAVIRPVERFRRAECELWWQIAAEDFE